MIARRHALGGIAAMTISSLLPEAALAAASGRAPAQLWDALLAKYVVTGADGLNRVRYGAWKANAGDMAALDQVVQGFAASKVSALPRPEQFCLWANLYNALTLQVVLARFPVSSIREIKPNPLALGPWKVKRVLMEGKSLSLDDIEHGILRKQWREPRVHYAVNCASVGCPNLGRRGWHSQSLDGDLTAAAKAFINSPRGVAIVGAQRVRVSSIYQWFKEDFGKSDAGILAHLKLYAAPTLAAQLQNARIVGHDYDWSINAAQAPA